MRSLEIKSDPSVNAMAFEKRKIVYNFPHPVWVWRIGNMKIDLVTAIVIVACFGLTSVVAVAILVPTQGAMIVTAIIGFGGVIFTQLITAAGQKQAVVEAVVEVGNKSIEATDKLETQINSNLAKRMAEIDAKHKEQMNTLQMSAHAAGVEEERTRIKTIGELADSKTAAGIVGEITASGTLIPPAGTIVVETIEAKTLNVEHKPNA